MTMQTESITTTFTTDQDQPETSAPAANPATPLNADITKGVPTHSARTGSSYRPSYLAVMELAYANHGVIDVNADSTKQALGKLYYRLATTISHLRKHPMTIRAERQGRTVHKYIFDAWK